jgi:cholesterol oxidase
MKLTIFKHVAILSGTGAESGCLIYANILPIPKTTFFKTGSWSTPNDWEKNWLLFIKKFLDFGVLLKILNYLMAILEYKK